VALEMADPCPKGTTYCIRARIEESSQTSIKFCIAVTTMMTLIQFFIIYVPSQQPQGQLQTQHSTELHNGHTQHKVKGKLQEHIIAEKLTNNKQAKMMIIIIIIIIID
jgi:hypothetical protein